MSEITEEEQARRDANNIYLVADHMQKVGKITNEQHEKVDYTHRTKEARALLNKYLVANGHEPYEFEDIVLFH